MSRIVRRCRAQCVRLTLSRMRPFFKNVVADQLASRIHRARRNEDVCNCHVEENQSVSRRNYILLILNECTKDNEEIKRQEQHNGNCQTSELDSPSPNGAMVCLDFSMADGQSCQCAKNRKADHQQLGYCLVIRQNLCDDQRYRQDECREEPIPTSDIDQPLRVIW